MFFEKCKAIQEAKSNMETLANAPKVIDEAKQAEADAEMSKAKK